MPAKYSPEVKAEAIEQMKEGKNNTEISRTMGISTTTLRSWRKDANLPSSDGVVRYTTEQLNDVIDLIREGNTIAEIRRQTGVQRKKIKQWREEEIRNGNPLPDFTPQLPPNLKYTDEEIIELTYLNCGFGLKRFIDMLGMRESWILNLFSELKEFTNGDEDLVAYLQDPSTSRTVTREEYHEITGIPRVGGGNIGVQARNMPLPPQEFNWGPYSPRSRYD